MSTKLFSVVQLPCLELRCLNSRVGANPFRRSRQAHEYARGADPVGESTPPGHPEIVEDPSNARIDIGPRIKSLDASRLNRGEVFVDAAPNPIYPSIRRKRDISTLLAESCLDRRAALLLVKDLTPCLLEGHMKRGGHFDDGFSAI